MTLVKDRDPLLLGMALRSLPVLGPVLVVVFGRAAGLLLTLPTPATDDLLPTLRVSEPR